MAKEHLLVVEDEEDILEFLLMDEPGRPSIGAICTNPADKPTERSITGRFG